MKFSVILLKTPMQDTPVMRAYVLQEALDVVEAALRATALLEEEFPGTDGMWWAISATRVDAETPRPRQTGDCGLNDT